jgi:hypothetical protein
METVCSPVRFERPNGVALQRRFLRRALVHGNAWLSAGPPLATFVTSPSQFYAIHCYPERHLNQDYKFLDF